MLLIQLYCTSIENGNKYLYHSQYCVSCIYQDIFCVSYQNVCTITLQHCAILHCLPPVGRWREIMGGNSTWQDVLLWSKLWRDYQGNYFVSVYIENVLILWSVYSMWYGFCFENIWSNNKPLFLTNVALYFSLSWFLKM